MKLSMLLFLLATACLAGDPPAGVAVYINLSGPWRTAWGDDSRYASPDFDDASWQVQRLPMPSTRDQQPPAPIRWFRRAVALPDVARNARLAVTVGSLEGVYEVYADGTMVARTGAFDLAAMRIPQPMTFEFLHGTAPILHLAIRLWRPPEVFPNAWRPADQGPWLLTTPNAVPRNAGLVAVALARANRFGDLMQPIVLFCLATPVLLIWLRDRSRTALLWLFWYLLVAGLARADLFAEINPWSRPYAHAEIELRLFMALAPAVLFALFVSAWAGVRWILGPVAAAAAIAALLARQEPGWQINSLIWCIQILSVAALAIHVVRRRRDAALAAAAVAVIYTHTVAWVQTGFSLGRQAYEIGGWFPIHVVPHTIALVAFTFAISLVEVRRLVRDREEKLRLAGEFEAARTVQRLMLPVQPDPGRAYAVEAIYHPAQEVGGDFYVVEPQGDGSLLIAVGDVSGKGLKAALVVSMVVGAIRTRRCDPPASILSEVNRLLCGRMEGGFVTCLCLRLDSSGRYQAANAGHIPPWIDGGEWNLPAGLPLGIDPDAVWEVTDGMLPANSRVLLISDGILEAANQKHELFGFERTAAISGQTASAIAEAARSWGQNDDITVVTVQRATA